MIVSKDMLDKARTRNGGYTGVQVKMAQKLFGGKWKKQMEGSEVDQEFWLLFMEGRDIKHKKKPKRKEIINKMTTKRDQFWKPEKRDIPRLKIATVIINNHLDEDLIETQSVKML